MIACNDLVPEWACSMGYVAGWVGKCIWFVVLWPQLHHNWKRGHTRGLSTTWALSNFTGSLINAFYVYRTQSSEYLMVLSAFYPTVELMILYQIWHYRDRIGFNKIDPNYNNIVDNRYNTGLVLCCILWCICAALEIMFPTLTNDLQWMAIFLWSVCTFPQLRVNARLGHSDGQANLTVLITVLGKTADVLKAFLVDMPQQHRTLTFYSAATAYINALQVIYYIWKRHVTAPSESNSNDNDEENTVHASLLKKEEQLGWGSEAEEGGESDSDYDYMGNENQGKGKGKERGKEGRGGMGINGFCRRFIFKSMVTALATAGSGGVVLCLGVLVYLTGKFVEVPLSWSLFLVEGFAALIFIVTPEINLW